MADLGEHRAQYESSAAAVCDEEIQLGSWKWSCTFDVGIASLAGNVSTKSAAILKSIDIWSQPRRDRSVVSQAIILSEQ
jgi:hypothetical protein